MATYSQATPYHGSSLNAEDTAEYEQAIPYQGPSLNAEIIAKYETDQTKVGRQAIF